MVCRSRNMRAVGVGGPHEEKGIMVSKHGDFR